MANAAAVPQSDIDESEFPLVPQTPAATAAPAAPAASDIDESEFPAVPTPAGEAPAAKEGPEWKGRVTHWTEYGPVFDNPEDNTAYMQGLTQFHKNVGLGIARGARDIVDKGAQLLTRGLEAAAPAGSSFETYMKGQREHVEDINKQAEENYQKGRGENAGPDIGRVIGNTLATGPLAAAVPGAAAAGLIPRVAAGAVGGGIAGGLTQPIDTTQNPDFWAQERQQAGLGAIGGAAVPAVLGGAAKMVSPSVRPQVQKVMEAGVTPTPGQILGGAANRIEEAAQSIPLVGDVIKGARGRAAADVNRAAINQSLAPIGEKLNDDTPLGRQAIAEMHDKIDSAYGKLLPTLKVQADPTFVTNMQTLVRGAQGQLHPDLYPQFENTIRNTIGPKFSSSGGMTGESFKQIDSDLGRLASNYQNSSVGSERELGAAYKQLQAEMRGMVERGNPDKAKELQAINDAYASHLRVQRAAGYLSSPEGVFTPSGLLSAVKAEDPTRGSAAFARGRARMQDFADAAKTVVGDKVPDSGTPLRGAVLAAGALGPLYAANPAAAVGAGIAGGIGAGLYSKPGQASLAALLARRPSGADAVAQLLRTRGTAALPAVVQAEQQKER